MKKIILAAGMLLMCAGAQGGALSNALPTTPKNYGQQEWMRQSRQAATGLTGPIIYDATGEPLRILQPTNFQLSTARK